MSITAWKDLSAIKSKLNRKTPEANKNTRKLRDRLEMILKYFFPSPFSAFSFHFSSFFRVYYFRPVCNLQAFSIQERTVRMNSLFTHSTHNNFYPPVKKKNFHFQSHVRENVRKSNFPYFFFCERTGEYFNTHTILELLAKVNSHIGNLWHNHTWESLREKFLLFHAHSHERGTQHPEIHNFH